LLNVVNPLHRRTARDYLGRMSDDKVECSRIARQYGIDYWDGSRRHGYGGFRYDGRWAAVAAGLRDAYQLPTNARILDIGCGKGFVLYEFTQLLPGCTVVGCDISAYGIATSKEEIRDRLFVHSAKDRLPFPDGHFDLVLSINALHNLPVQDLKTALGEMERVGRNKYLCVEGFRSEEELFNLQCWALTCESFFRPESWVWLFSEFGYTGDYEFIYFEGAATLPKAA
jgi:SAM-dependent methyltransferase